MQTAQKLACAVTFLSQHLCIEQALYRLYHPECGPAPGPCGITLQAWIAVFGASQLILSQVQAVPRPCMHACVKFCAYLQC